MEVKKKILEYVNRFFYSCPALEESFSLIRIANAVRTNSLSDATLSAFNKSVVKLIREDFPRQVLDGVIQEFRVYAERLNDLNNMHDCYQVCDSFLRNLNADQKQAMLAATVLCFDANYTKVLRGTRGCSLKGTPSSLWSDLSSLERCFMFAW